MAVLSAIALLYLFVYKGLLSTSEYIEFSVWNELPLQPCNVVAVVAVPAALVKQPKLGEALRAYCFYSGLLFVPLALVMPVDGFSNIPLFSVNAIGFYGFHGLVLIAAVSFVSLGLYRPRYRHILVVVLETAALAAFAHGVNFLLRRTVYPDANYFYTYGLEGNIVLSAIKSWIPLNFVYLLPLVPVMALLCFVLTLIVDLPGRIRRRKIELRRDVSNDPASVSTADVEQKE